MKRLVGISIFLISIALFSDKAARAKESYAWENAAAPGKGCFPPACREGQFPMAILPLIAFDGKLYSIGDKRIWTSSDAANWRSEPKTDWGERYGMRFAFFKNRLWVLAGMRTWDDFLSDVWSSSDGKKWQMEFEHAPWRARSAIYSVSFNNKLWIFSGKTGRADTRTGDIWAMSKKEVSEK
jgi:hypothetical protein